MLPGARVEGAAGVVTITVLVLGLVLGDTLLDTAPAVVGAGAVVTGWGTVAVWVVCCYTGVAVVFVEGTAHGSTGFHGIPKLVRH